MSEIVPVEDVSAAEPATSTGMLVGYGRVSTSGQKLDRQVDALQAAGCARIFTDTQSGKDADRPELTAALDYARPGDTLVVPSLDRLGRSLQDLISIVGQLRRAGVGFRSLHESIDTTTPGRPAGLPRLRGPGRVHSRIDRARHQRKPGCGTVSGPTAGTAAGHECRTDPAGQSLADPAGEHGLLDRAAARGVSFDDLQIHSGIVDTEEIAARSHEGPARTHQHGTGIGYGVGELDAMPYLPIRTGFGLRTTSTTARPGIGVALP